MSSIARLALSFCLNLAAINLYAAAPINQTSKPELTNDELRKVALVIGNATYVNASPLANSSNDAADVCTMLKTLDFDVICKLNIPSKREFKDAIYEFTGKVNENTVALFYFAGHGLQIDGVNYLIPTKAALKTKSDIDDESLQINYLMSELEPREAALNIFLLDACRNNPFVNSIRGYAPAVGFASQLYAPRNSIIAMSTGPGQLSLDGAGRNGTFTKNILKFISTPKQTIEDMLKNASGATRAEAMSLGRQQHPQITSSYTEKYCLMGCQDKKSLKVDEQSAEMKEKQAELDRLKISIAQTKEKQKELEDQKNELLRKQGEIDKMKAILENTQNQQGELDKKRQDLLQKQKEIDSIETSIHASAARLNELDAEKKALLLKQNELNKILEELSAQQDSINSKKKDIQSRIIEEKNREKKPKSIIIPAF